MNSAQKVTAYTVEFRTESMLGESKFPGNRKEKGQE